METACLTRGPRCGLGSFVYSLVSVCWAAAIGFTLLGCDRRAQVPGQLVVTLQTDMTLPQQIDSVLVQVTRRGGEVLFMQPFSLGGPQDYRVPGSLTLVAGQRTEPITILVAGSKKDVWRTYREIVTTIPRDRVAELRMPIQWLCNESAQPQLASMADGKGGVVNHVVQNCDDGFTCKAGSCVANETDSSSLPDFMPQALFGGAQDAADGTCFDVVRCMAEGTTVAPDEKCTIAKPDGDDINVGLRVAGGGICNTFGPTTTCFVPLDGDDPEGWTLTPDGTRLQLPVAVCTRIAERKVLAVQTSTACRTKDSSLPPCGPWSSVPDDRAIVPLPDTPAANWPSPQLLTSVPVGGASVCCPLMSEGDQLYTCTCGDAGPTGTVYAIDGATGTKRAYPVSMRPSFAAAVWNQTLYWASDSAVLQMPMQLGATPTSFPAPGGVYRNGVLRADQSGVYVLTSGLGDPTNDAQKVVQLLRFSLSGKLESMDPIGNRAVKQFDQDASAFYVAKNVDEIKAQGQPFQRVSSVVRIDKQTQRATTLLNEQKMTITDLRYNGYLGVVSDGTDVFALFESQPSAGVEQLQIGRVVHASTAQPQGLTPIFALPVQAEPHYTTLRLLGAVDGAVVFARDELQSQSQLRSSSVLVIPRDGTTARFVADFATDAPVAGIAMSEDRIFWLNQSGRIFTLSREALVP